MKDLCINGTSDSLLMHGFSLVNARLLMAFGTAFYAITLASLITDADEDANEHANAYSATTPGV